MNDERPHTPILVFNSTRVSVRSNRMEEGRGIVPGAIKVTEDCGEVDVRGNTLSRGK